MPAEEFPPILRRLCDLWHCFWPPQSRLLAVNARYSWCRAEISRDETTSHRTSTKAIGPEWTQHAPRVGRYGPPVHSDKALLPPRRQASQPEYGGVGWRPASL